MRVLAAWCVVALAGCHLLFPLDSDGVVGDASLDGPGDDAPKLCQAELDTDPNHCGRCFHDCNGGGCSGAKCQPVEVARNQPGPLRIALSDEHVYWISVGDSALRRSKKRNAAVEQLTTQAGITDVAADSVHVYFTASGGVYRCEHTGCGGPATKILDCTTPGELALTTDRVFYTCPSASQVVRSLKNGPNEEPFASAQSDLQGIAAEGLDVYWAQKGTDQVMVSTNNTNPAEFVPALDVEALAIDGANLYWSSSQTGIVDAVSRPGGVSTRLADLDDGIGPKALAAANGVVYFVGGANVGYLRACAAAGCNLMPIDLLAETLDNPADVAADLEDVYFSVEFGANGGTIQRVAR